MSDDSWLQEAQTALQKNDKASVRWHLVRRLKENAHDEAAWLLLARAVERKEETIFCLEQALKLNPANQTARKGLEILRSRPASRFPARETDRFQPTEVKPSPEEAPGANGLEMRKPGGKVAPRADSNGLVRAPRRALNWPLTIGLVLLAFMTLFAIFGPSAAPRDPLQENLIIQINGKWYVPPFPLLTPGFPLGSDTYGRDMYSRVLWAVRPTLVMVLTVACVRLFLGTSIGLMAGWVSGRAVRWLEMLIQGALAIPVLLVALGVIAVAVDWGVWAFVLGLGLTGWVETAVQVREQTRIVKGQVYIEASHALGATGWQLLFNHVLRQLLPIMTMLFAFEASSTLMVTAGLGFLGYYIGGDRWVVVGDFVARRISGMPELGQMLSTSWTTLTRPEVMFVTGSTIFVMVLGFNLTGEGLRQRLALEMVRRRGAFVVLQERWNFWLDQNLWHPLAVFSHKPALRLGVLVWLALSLLGAGGVRLAQWMQARPPQRLEIQANQEATQAQTGGSGREKAAAEAAPESSQAPGALQPEIAWTFQDQSGFSAGPALAPQGQVLYVAANSGVLYALRGADGGLLWKQQLPFAAVGAPALDEAGNVYLSDARGGLSAFDPEGQLRWHFQSEAAARSVSGPTVGQNGVYYTVSNNSFGWVQAVSASGEALWATQAKTASFYQTPVLSKDEKYIFLKDDLFEADSGRLLEVESPLKVLRYFTGEDGQDYLIAGNTIIQWALQGQRLVILAAIEPAEQVSQVYAPWQLGVLPDGTSWKLYSSPGGKTSLSWVKVDGTVVGKAEIDLSNGLLVGQKPDLTTYVCGGGPFEDQEAECVAVRPNGEKPLWRLDLGKKGLAAGGLCQDGRLYITTSSGLLVAIAEMPTGRQVTGSPAALAGMQWSFAIQDGVRLAPQLGPQGSVYILDQAQNMQVIAADGTLAAKFRLPKDLFVLRGSFGSGDPIWPLILPDGSLVVVSKENSVYALDPQGNLRWEVQLEGEPQKSPYQSGDGDFYLLDNAAGLSAFDINGLRWRFKSSAAQISAHGLVAGPDGAVYYVVTNRSKGFVQAVSRQGQSLWVVDAKTQSFYDELEITADGSQLALHEDLIDTRRGELLEVNLPERIDQWIMGYDGRTYLRSGHTVKEWRIGPQGFEILASTNWGAQSSDHLPPYQAFVDGRSVIWLLYRQQLVWVALDGTVLGTQRLDSSGSGQMTQYNFEASQYLTCRHFPRNELLQCQLYEPGSKEPLQEASVSGVPTFSQAFVVDGYAYLLANNSRMLLKVYLGVGAGG